VVLTTGVKQTTLEQDNNAPQKPIYYMYPNEPKRRQADPSDAKLYVCSIINKEIHLANVDLSQTNKLVSLFPYNIRGGLASSFQNYPDYEMLL
jgi:hypothetical protein